MADVTKQARVVGLKENGTLTVANPAGGAPLKVPTMLLTIVLGEGTPGEQRATFMVLASDYADLDAPGFGDPISVTLSNPPAT